MFEQVLFLWSTLHQTWECFEKHPVWCVCHYVIGTVVCTLTYHTMLSFAVPFLMLNALSSFAVDIKPAECQCPITCTSVGQFKMISNTWMHTSIFIIPEEVKGICVFLEILCTLSVLPVIFKVSLSRCVLLSLSKGRGRSSGTWVIAPSVLSNKRTGGMLTIIILGSTSLNKAKGPSHQIHTATKWASEALRHLTQVCVWEPVCVHVCVMERQIEWVWVCGMGWGGETDKKKCIFLPELGNLQHKAKWNLLFVVIISFLYIYNPPRIVSNLCTGTVYR